jgi:hypothetical protein
MVNIQTSKPQGVFVLKMGRVKDTTVFFKIGDIECCILCSPPLSCGVICVDST